METPILDRRETATVLHALRLLQEYSNGYAECAFASCSHFDGVEQLTDAQVDALCDRLSRQIRTVGQTAGISPWGPLEKVLPDKSECELFMFMGIHDGIHTYKNRNNRAYLNVDRQGRTYRYVSKSNGYALIAKEAALAAVFDELPPLQG